MKRLRNVQRGVSCLLMAVLLLTMVFNLQGDSMAKAATTNTKKTTANYITARSFIKKLVTSIELEVDKNESMPYIRAAFNAGILEQNEISSFDAYITREECAVLLNRADEYLNGDTLDTDYVQLILDKRISDIEDIDKNKREAVAKVYGKGIIKGYSNGYGVQSREFRGKNYVTKGSAKNFINLVLNSQKRAKLSPDAQLIRTTNLPKNADKYDYILECFPNSFYEKKYLHEFIISSTAPVEEGETYIYPVNMKNSVYRNSHEKFDMGEIMDLYLYDWADYVEQYANLIFNVSYKTIGDSWTTSVKNISTSNNVTDSLLENYISCVKNNKVTIQARKIAVEPSTFHYDFYGYHIRVYVEYKVTATKYFEDVSNYIFCQGGTIKDLKLNRWTTSYFDIELADSDGFYGDGSTIRPYQSWFEIE